MSNFSGGAHNNTINAVYPASGNWNISTPPTYTTSGGAYVDQPQIQWQTTSSGASYTSASNVLTK